MKIYTKTGDNGTTGLYDGSRVQKSEQILDVLGSLDELSAHIGSLIYTLKKSPQRQSNTLLANTISMFLPQLQQHLLNIGSIIATPNPTENIKLPQIMENDVENIEKWIDCFDKHLEPLTTFIIQDGKNEEEVNAHICRTITRRVERELNKYGNVDDNVLKFINRLSDYFFTLARFVSECPDAIYLIKKSTKLPQTTTS